MTVAEQLAEFVVHTRRADIDPVALEHGAMVLSSTIASCASGIDIDSARIVRELALERAGSPQSSLWFHAPHALPATDAAQANAIAADAAASDDSDLRNIVHSGNPASCAAIAIAELVGAPGEEIDAAIVLGYECAGRIAAAMTPQFRQRGFHGSHGAVFASTVAAGRLLGLDAGQMANAIALAATSIGGMIIAADTSTAREFHGALATSLGINAALVAGRGYLCELAVLEAPRGFLESLGGVDGAVAGAAVLEGLGESFDIVTDLAIKLVPGAHAYHSIAEAAALAATEGEVDPTEVVRITISRPDFAALPGPRHPHDLVSMAHSPAYFAAAGVVDRTFGFEHASLDKITDPRIHALVDLVEVGEPPEPAESAGFRQGSVVTIELRDGSAHRASIAQPKGSGSRGIAWQDLDTKYRALLSGAGVDPALVEAGIGALHRLAELEHARELTGLLRIGG